MKNTVLKGIAKGAEKAVKEACGSKCCVLLYEADMPAQLKAKKLRK